MHWLPPKKFCGMLEKSAKSLQTTSSGTRIRAAHGIARHVRARPGRHARLTARAVCDPDQLSRAAERCVSTLNVTTTYLKSSPESCVCGTVSQIHATSASPDRCVRASPDASTGTTSRLKAAGWTPTSLCRQRIQSRSQLLRTHEQAQ